MPALVMGPIYFVILDIHKGTVCGGRVYMILWAGIYGPLGGYIWSCGRVCLVMCI